MPCHHGSSRSSIEIEPSPCGLSAATRRYIGSAPKSVISTRISVAIGDERAGGERGDAGLVAERREVVDAGQAHDLPPGMLVGMLLRHMRAFRLLRLSVHEPPLDPPV